jgi:hypothetical protein
MPSPATLNDDHRAATMAERLRAKLLDAELAALDLPPLAVAAVAPGATTPAARLAFADYIVGAVHRAGLTRPFWAVFASDAVTAQDGTLCPLAGCREEREPSNGGPPILRWVLPEQVPYVMQSEEVARELAARLVRSGVARQEGGAHG